MTDHTQSPTDQDFKDAFLQLDGMRRDIIGCVLPLVNYFGFNVIENRLIPAPTLMLPPLDYKIFKELLSAVAPPVLQYTDAAQNSDAPVQPPPADGGVGPTEQCCERDPVHHGHQSWCKNSIYSVGKPICSADGCSRTEHCGPFCRDRGNL